MKTISLVASVTIRVTLPKYYLSAMRHQSKSISGCVRPNISSESHFARIAIEEKLTRCGRHFDIEVVVRKKRGSLCL